MGPRPHPTLFNISDISLFFFFFPSGGGFIRSSFLAAVLLPDWLRPSAAVQVDRVCLCESHMFVCSQAELAVGGHVIRGSSDPPSLFDLIAGSAGRGRGPG